MIYHNVCFKLKDNVTKDVTVNMINELNKLADAIDSVDFLVAAENFSDRSQGFSVHLVSTFKTKNALNTYLEHPAHVNAVEKYIKPFLDQLVVSDIEA